MSGSDGGLGFIKEADRSYTPPLMATRRTRRAEQGRPRKSLAVFSAAALAVLLAAGWLTPAVLVHTSLRDRPLAAVLAGTEATISSRSARWSWLAGIEYRDVVVADAAGNPVILIPSLALEKGILGLAATPKQIGTVRLAGLEAVVVVRPGGSSLEDLLAPLLEASDEPTGVACDLELVGGTVELVDTQHEDAWRLADLVAAASLSADGSISNWTLAGRVQHVGLDGRDGKAGEAAAGASPPERPPAVASQLTRGTITAAAASALARDGGWSVAAAPGDSGSEPSLAITAHRLPLGISSVAAARFGSDTLIDGLADIRLDLTSGDTGRVIGGRIVAEQLAVCRTASLVEVLRLPRCEVPLELVVDDETVRIRELRVASPVFEAEASGRLPLPAADPWQWLTAAVGLDCSLSARVDLAAAAAAVPGGLAVRPDARITGGTLQFAAIARPDGGDRVLEIRLDTRDLAAIRTVAGDPGEPPSERPLRWNEPLSAWARGRRGPGSDASLRIEEGRITSQAVEVSASGTPAALEVQWIADLDDMMAEVSELLDLGGLRLAGTSRGRVSCQRAGGGLSEVKMAASVKDFLLDPPGPGVWRDQAIRFDAELIGSQGSPGTIIEQGRAMLTADGDTLEVTLAGGVAVDAAAWARRSRPPLAAWIKPAAHGMEATADCSLAGDVGRWHARLAALLPAVASEDVAIGGRLEAAAAVTPDATAGGDAWRVTKLTATIEDFMLEAGDRQAREPRIVATAAGRIWPGAGRVDISSAEVLSSSLSFRSGGVAWLAQADADLAATATPLDQVFAQLRGRLQWQADLSRLERWLVTTSVAEAWPLTGRAWGTFDVAPTQTGVNLLAEVTGSQVAVTRGPPQQGEPRVVWREPQASLVVELTRPLDHPTTGKAALADRLVINRLAVESSTFAMAAQGGVEGWSGRRLASLEGSISYDWAQLSRLATPWTGGRVRLSGSMNRPFAIRGPLGVGPGRLAAGESPASKQPAATVGTLALPEAWLAATQGGGQDPAAGGEVTVPIRPASARLLVDRLRDISLETSAAWTAADIDGFPLAAGDVAIRLLEGQLAFGPFDVAASGGRVRGAPWLRFGPRPSELVVPPGRLVDRVHLTGDLSNRFVSLISPLLGQATDTSAVVSVDLAGARLPLADPLAGEASGKVVFGDFQVRPSGAMQPLVSLLAKLQAAIDPRFALSDQPVLLRVRPEPIRLRLAGRRLAHEGLVMDSGPLMVTSRGSIGDDGSLAMRVEVAFRGDVAGQTPVVAQLLRTPIAIPLKGTLARPQFDAGAIDVTVKRILENTARAVVDEGISRGLEALFGRPQPAPRQPPAQPNQPGPLILPR